MTRQGRARRLEVAALRAAFLAFTATGPLAVTPALANGRYPAAQQLVVDPSDASRLWLRATYGILTSGDAGKTWNWLCESSVGYGTGEDPFLLVTGDGTALLATAEGLLVSRDHGCNFAPHPDLGDRFALDLAATPDDAHVFAMTSVVDEEGNYALVVWQSDDAGASFRALGPAIANDVAALTVDVAPSDPSRLYVTGLPVPRLPASGGSPDAGPAEPEAVLLRSRNGGASWERKSVPSSNLRDWPYVAAVHPTRPDVLYVRVRGRPRVQSERIESWLLVSEDAGDTWKEVFRAQADLFGFALGPGGTPVWLGLGDSREVQRKTDAAALGIYRSDGLAGPFEHVLDGPVGCLTRSTDGLYGCRTQEAAGFELGLSTDRGVTLSPLLAMGPQIVGPPACEVGAGAARCAAEWPNACPGLNACGSPPDGGGVVPIEGGAKPPEKKPKGGADCSCRIGGAVDGSAGAVSLALLLGVVALARRRR